MVGCGNMECSCSRITTRQIILPFEFVSGLFLFGSKHTTYTVRWCHSTSFASIKNWFQNYAVVVPFPLFLFVASNASRKLALLNYLQGQMHNAAAYLLFDFQTLALWDISLLLRCCLVALQANRSIHPSKHPITCPYEILAITKAGWLQSIWKTFPIDWFIAPEYDELV